VRSLRFNLSVPLHVCQFLSIILYRIERIHNRWPMINLIYWRFALGLFVYARKNGIIRETQFAENSLITNN
jgi:hypothetical protein